MSRYIDADALIVNMRGAFIDHVEEFRAITIVEDAPSIDIVRCKECKHYYDGHWCSEWEYLKKNPDDFCSYGEREGE